jgi:hypothetical protein
VDVTLWYQTGLIIEKVISRAHREEDDTENTESPKETDLDDTPERHDNLELSPSQGYIPTGFHWNRKVTGRNTDLRRTQKMRV